MLAFLGIWTVTGITVRHLARSLLTSGLPSYQLEQQDEQSHSDNGIIKFHVGEPFTCMPCMWLMLHAKIS